MSDAPRVRLLFGVHDHQPVGNFDHVFRVAVDRSYRPFLETIAAFPWMRLSLHVSGPLLEWIEDNDRPTLDLLVSLSSTGQIELMGGGFYEPVLGAITRRDAVGQMRLMADRLEQRFGLRPTGFWLTERVWDQDIPAIAAESGYAYTVADDTHFLNACLKPEELFGYYLTERGEHQLAVYPIDRRLRYAIPFEEPARIIDYLQSLGNGGPVSVTYADDGEKFGIWPGTWQWVFGEKWLERFCRTVGENRDWLVISPFAEHLTASPASGRVFLPLSSYHEMMTWTLPPDDAPRFERLLEEHKGAPEERFLRGGLWHNFLVRYSESNRIQKRAVRLSGLLAGRPADDPAVRALYRAECNCGYWHGLFGGVYLSHLRSALLKNLIEAESLCAKAIGRIEVTDMLMKGGRQLLVRGRRLNLFVDPAEAGTSFAFELPDRKVALDNVMTRRLEHYHLRLLEQEDAGPSPAGDAPGKPRSIHDIEIANAAELRRELVFDPFPRQGFRTFLLPADYDFSGFQHGDFDRLAGGFHRLPYRLDTAVEDGPLVRIELSSDGAVKGVNHRLHKRFAIDPDAGRIDFSAAFATPAPAGRLAVELSINLEDNRRPERRGIRVDGSPLALERADIRRVRASVEIVNHDDDWSIAITAGSACHLMAFPVNTVSHSEAGIETNYQGTALVFVFDAAGDRLRADLSLTAGRADG